jgi:hypothetical protein
MTKNEALKAMKEGHKVTHRFFTSEEFVQLDKQGRIIDESGYILTSFWNYRPDECWNTDWSIYQESEVQNG